MLCSFAVIDFYEHCIYVTSIVFNTAIMLFSHILYCPSEILLTLLTAINATVDFDLKFEVYLTCKISLGNWFSVHNSTMNRNHFYLFSICHIQLSKGE